MEKKIWHGLVDQETREPVRLGPGDGLVVEPYEGKVGIIFWTHDKRKVCFGKDSVDDCLVMRPNSPDLAIIIDLITQVLGVKARYVEGLYPQVCGSAPAFRLTSDEEGQAWEFYV